MMIVHMFPLRLSTQPVLQQRLEVGVHGLPMKPASRSRIPSVLLNTALRSRIFYSLAEPIEVIVRRLGLLVCCPECVHHYSNGYRPFPCQLACPSHSYRERERERERETDILGEQSMHAMTSSI
jgi:hypothetical protein